MPKKYSPLPEWNHLSMNPVNTHHPAKMVKRGSKYLRYALFTAAKNVSKWDDNFRTFFQKKLAEGKHYNVAISHVTKKLVRVLYSMEMKHEAYIK